MAMEFAKGIYFNPKDADLLHLLRLKVSGEAVLPQQYGLIWDREVYQDEMPCDFFVGDFAHHPQLYFFTTLKTKFQNGNADRKDRAVGTGYWRTQRTVKVPDPDDDNSFLGFRTMLNFFHYGTKTGSKWIMHEYTLPPAAKQQGLAVCRIKRSSRKSADSSPASSSSSGPVKRKATPLDHHKKRPHFSHPQSQVAPTITQSPLTPLHISASPLDDDDHSDHTVSHDTPEAAAAATPDDDDDADYVHLLENELTKEDDFLDSDVAALHPENEVIIIEDDLDSDASPLHPDVAASPLVDDHSETVCHDTPEATPDDDDAEYVHLPENELIIIEDDLDSNVSALTAQHLEPATAHHQHMIPPPMLYPVLPSELPLQSQNFTALPPIDHHVAGQELHTNSVQPTTWMALPEPQPHPESIPAEEPPEKAQEQVQDDIEFWLEMDSIATPDLTNKILNEDFFNFGLDDDGTAVLN